MELRYLEIFCAVVERKSFSRAAERLHLTQPTISFHIKALEEEFSTRLLDRLGRSIMPTREGEILYRYAREIMNLKEGARDAMERVQAGVSGKLLVAASTIPGEYLLPGYLARFVAIYPEVFPALRIGDSGEIRRSVLEGECDLGIVGSAARDRNLVTRKFLDDELVLVAAPEYKAPGTSDLRSLPLLMRETGSGSRAAVEEHLKKRNIPLGDLRVVAELGSSQALIRAVREGMGLAFISRLPAAEEIRRKTLKEIKFSGSPLARSFYIITHRLRHDSPLCATFADFLASGRAGARSIPSAAIAG